MLKSSAALLVALLVLGTTFGYYYEASRSSMASAESHVSALQSRQSISDSIVTSGSQQIASLESRDRISGAVWGVVFFQNSTCLIAFPWGVELGNVTKTNPPGTTIQQGGSYVTATGNETSITFSLQDGTYYYALLPLYDFIDSQTQTPNDTGSFQVNGADVTIPVMDNCPPGL